MSEARAAPNSYGFLFMFPYPRAKVPQWVEILGIFLLLTGLSDQCTYLI